MLKIEIMTSGSLRHLRLIGDLRNEELQELERHLPGSSEEVALGLGELKIVDLSAVRFLIGCEERGVRVLDCPFYVREWMSREKERGKSGQGIERGG